MGDLGGGVSVRQTGWVLTVGLLALSLIVGVAPAGGISASPPRVPPGFFGVNTQFLPNYSDSELERAAASMAEMGIEEVRKGFNWIQVEQTGPDNENWTVTDRLVEALANEGITVRPLAAFAPVWARDELLCPWRKPHRCRPSERNVTGQQRTGIQYYADYTADIVRRYGAGGDFWVQNPEVPAHPVRSVEIWNEQNSDGWYEPKADPVLFGKMYRGARTAMKAVGPSVTAIVGGLQPIEVGDANHVPYRDFLAGMGQLQTIDAVAIHSYAKTAEPPSSPGIVTRVVGLRDWMDTNGLADRPIFLNEWGWISNEWQGGFEDPNNPNAGLTEAERSRLYEDVSDLLGRSDCGLGQVAPHTWETAYEEPTDPEHWFGIAKIDDDTGDELSPTATTYGQQVLRFRGDLTGAPRATVHICGRPAPDTDGDGVEDQHDYAPIDPSVAADPVASAPTSYEPPKPYRAGLRRPDRERVVVDHTVTAFEGTWDGSPLAAFSVEHWEHCDDASGTGCQVLAGASGWQAVPGPALAGRYLRVTVTATNSLGVASATSDPVLVETAPVPVAPPTISGEPRISRRLTARTGEWQAIPDPTYSYAWYACDSSGCQQVGDKQTYNVGLPAFGKQIEVRVTATNRWGAETQVSDRTNEVTL